MTPGGKAAGAMHAMCLHATGEALREVTRPVPEPGPGQILIGVSACAVCRTDLHVADGELPQTRLPVIPGHEIVGRVVRRGAGVDDVREGDRVGVPWLGWTCGTCRYCLSGRENLCPDARFTGCQIDGGFADYTVADARYCFPLPDAYDDIHAAPLLCAGLIGFRTLQAGGEARRVGIYGFGAAAHIAAQVARGRGQEIYAFTRPGDEAAQALAHRTGAVWAGGSQDAPPEPLDAALIFAPVGALVSAALRAVSPGGTVVCGGIHMSDIPAFPYALLWQERCIRSVANLTRQDARDFLSIAARQTIRTECTPYALDQANTALADLRHGRFSGAAVLLPAAAMARSAAPEG